MKPLEVNEIDSGSDQIDGECVSNSGENQDIEAEDDSDFEISGADYTEEDKLSLWSDSETDYYSFGSSESIHSSYYVSKIEKKTEDTSDYGEISAFNTPVEIVSTPLPESEESSMLRSKKKKFSLSNESLNKNVVSTIPSMNHDNQVLTRSLSSSHPHLYSPDSNVLLNVKNQSNKSSWRPLKKLKSIFKSSPKLTEADVYNDAYLQSNNVQVHVSQSNLLS